jgi:hypothetical protein
MSSIKTASLEDIREKQKRGALIETRANAKAEDLPDGFWNSAELQKPREENIGAYG